MEFYPSLEDKLYLVDEKLEEFKFYVFLLLLILTLLNFLFYILYVKQAAKIKYLRRNVKLLMQNVLNQGKHIV